MLRITFIVCALLLSFPAPRRGARVRPSALVVSPETVSRSTSSPRVWAAQRSATSTWISASPGTADFTAFTFDRQAREHQLRRGPGLQSGPGTGSAQSRPCQHAVRDGAADSSTRPFLARDPELRRGCVAPGTSATVTVLNVNALGDAAGAALPVR